MADWMFKKGARRHAINLLALDSKLDSSVYGGWARLRRFWRAYSSFFMRFHLKGFRKFFASVLSEGLNLGVAGMLVLLGLALPAFKIIQKGDWKATGEYSVTLLDRYGNEIGHRGILHDETVPINELPDHLIKAVLATEDRRFFEHFGIDIIGTFRAIVENMRANGVVQGGSSLSQQLAKILFLSSERTLDRKIKEAFLALWLEQHYEKKEIMKLYLDRAYMGSGAHGVEAAAQLYFGKSVREVTLAEAAMMAGLFKAPSRYSPHANLPQARARANEVLDNMVEAGFMTEGQVHGARLNPALPVDREGLFNVPEYFLDWAFDETRELVKGKSEFTLTVQTTIDMELQQFADQAVSNILLPNRRPRRVSEAALVSMTPMGAVRAMVGGQDYGDSQFNRAVHAKRQPGSTFKPYVYLTALENGFTPSSRVRDFAVVCNRWSPKNYDRRYRGTMTLELALAKSINTIPVWLAKKVGHKKIVANTRKLGLKGVRPNCTMPIGTAELSLLEHTGGYAGFANGGKYIRPFAVVEIRNSKGMTIYSRDKDGPKPEQIFEREHIENLNYMLGKVVSSGTGRRAILDFTYSAGKTGTGQNYKDAFFVGFTGQFVTGVWYGNDDSSPTKRITGGSLPAQTWHDYMIKAHRSMNIPQIPGMPLHPVQVEEQKRIALLKKSNPNLVYDELKDKLMPDRTFKVLKKITNLMKKAKDEFGPVVPPGGDTQANGDDGQDQFAQTNR